MFISFWNISRYIETIQLQTISKLIFNSIREFGARKKRKENDFRICCDSDYEQFPQIQPKQNEMGKSFDFLLIHAESAIEVRCICCVCTLYYQSQCSTAK